MQKLVCLAMILILAGCSGESFRKTLETFGQGVEGGPAPLSSAEVAQGLKEALVLGAERAVASSSIRDGFYKNPRLFIPFPEEAAAVRQTALNLGLRSQVDRFEENLNRAAEEAVREATPIFVNAITSMSIQDAFGILNGGPNAATIFLRSRTEAELMERFRPEADKAVNSVELTKYWSPLAQAYNTASVFTGAQAVNPDLVGYVSENALDGLFLLVADEEARIREEPAARVSELLRRVFGSVD